MDISADIEDRIAALPAIAPTHTSALEPFKDMLDDPFSAEEVYADLNGSCAGQYWEPSLNRASHMVRMRTARLGLCFTDAC